MSIPKKFYQDLATKCLYISGFQSVDFRQASLASSGNLLEMQSLRPHPRPAESETRGVVPAVCVLPARPPGVSDACSSLRITAAHYVCNSFTWTCT